MKTVCVVTSSRADYDLLRGVIRGILDSEVLDLQLIVTGMHLETRFGDTIKAIENDNFPIAAQIPMLEDSDTSVGVSRAIGRGLLGFSDALNNLSPDLLVLLGDRFELLSAAASALVMRIPIAHIHGGETTERAFDEAIRHSITKMSAVHFVATETYRRRVIQLGEHPQTVHHVGGLGVDLIKQTVLLNQQEIQERLGIQLLDRKLMVTFHPVTLDDTSSEHQLNELLRALDGLTNTSILITQANADTQGHRLGDLLERFAHESNNVHFFPSLGNPLYLSCVSMVDAVVGNSSSGLLEAPTLGTPTVNIGGRQAGRLRASSVIDCEPERNAIRIAIDLAYSSDFQEISRETVNPYGTGGASKRIVQVLERIDPESLAYKTFFDVEYFNLNDGLQ